jgi:hypothetical protein
MNSNACFAKARFPVKESGLFFDVPGNCLIPAYVSGASPSHYVQFPGTNIGNKAAEPLCS